MFDSLTLAAYAAGTTPAERAQAVRDALGSGTLTVELRDGETLVYSGTFTGPMTAGSDGSLSADALLTGAVTTGGTPNAATWTCRIRNADGRYIEGSFGPGGRFTFSGGALVVGQAVRLRVTIAAAGASSALPLWAQGVAVHEWREIPGTAMSLYPPSIDPGRDSGAGPAAKIEAWCGLSIDTRTSTLWSVANGGHDDYHGNEVMKMTLSDDAPQWVEVLASSAAVDFTVPSDSARYSDGRPASTHSYYSQQIIEARNRAMRFGLGATSTIGNGKRNIDGFDITVAVGVNGWDAEPTYPSFPAFGSQAPVCKDPATEDVYVFNNNYSVFKWTQATNTISTVNTQWPPAVRLSATAFDTKRNRILLVKASGAWTYDVSAGTFTARTLQGTHAAAIMKHSRAMIYEPVLDKFLFCLGEVGSDVYVIDPVLFDVSLLPVTGGASVPAILSTTNDAYFPYTRFLYAPELGGVVWVARYASNAWFLRTH